MLIMISLYDFCNFQLMVGIFGAVATAGLSAQISDLQTQINTLTSTQNSLSSTVSSLSSSLSSLSSTVSSLSSSYSTLSTYQKNICTTVSNFKLLNKSQCGNFRIFLSFSFYVKSILKNLEVLKLPFLSFWGFEFC